MGSALLGKRFSGYRHLQRRRLFFERLEDRVLLDGGAAALADDLFDVQQNGEVQRLDVLGNDDLPPGYQGQRRITSVSYGSEGGRVEIADNGRWIWYTPPADFSGTETFVYFVDNALSTTVRVRLSSPLAFDQYEFPPDGQAKVLDVLGNDPFWAGYDGPGEITSVSTTSLGSGLSIAADGKSLVYTPSGDAYGQDAFVYIVDGLYPAQVKIRIADPLEDDRFDGIVQNSRDNVLDVLANDPLWPGYPGQRTITHVIDPGDGGVVTIAGDGKSLLYTPAPDFVGRHEFRYVVDGAYEASVSVKVRRPVRDDRFEVDTGTAAYPLMVTGNDYFEYRVGGAWVRRDVVDRVTSVGATAQGGTVETMPGGQGIYYSALVGFEGRDTFEYIADGKYRATVVVDVTRPVRDDRIGKGVYEDTVANFVNVLQNDFKGNGYLGPKVITAVGETSEGGIVTIAGGGRSLVYTPLAGFRGVDTFSYTVDGRLQAEVRLTVGAITSADSYRFDPRWSSAGYGLDVLTNDHFGANYRGPGVITAVGPTANGGVVTISGSGRSLRFVPAVGGSDRFTYTVDGQYEASVSVSIRNYLRSDSAVVDQNSREAELDPLQNDFRSSDARNYGGPRKITSVGPSAHGATVAIGANGKTLIYSPAPDFFGTDRFTYTVDGLMRQTVTVQVIRRVRDDVFHVEADGRENALRVLVNDLFGADYTGAGRITAVTETCDGGAVSVSADGRSILYTPPAGHTGEDKFTYTVDGALKAEVTVWVDTSVEEMLFRFDSLEELEQALLDDALQRYEHLFGQEGGGYDSFPYRTFTTPSDADSFGSSAVNASERTHSETNVQVDGVDESDIIETDGDYLYVLSGGELIIAKAWPAEELSIASRLSIEGSPIGAYLHGERLTVISRLWESWPGLADSWDAWQYGPATEKTLVTVYDVSDRGAPAIVERTELDGSYVESRRIDGTVFVVLRNNRVDLRLPGPEQIPLADDAGDWPERVDWLERSEGALVPVLTGPVGGLIITAPPMPVGHSFVYETRDQYIERMREEIGDYLESVLPGYASYDADGELVQSGLLHAPEDVFRPLCPDVQRLVSVVSLNVGDDEAGITASTGIFTTGASEIYGSLDNLYVFDEQYTSEDGRVTQILKFDWNAETGCVELAARGQVAGSMLNQFSADQYKGYLRIATTVDNYRSGNWSGRSENVLFVLGEDGGVLEFVGGMQNLALGERIRSVRFMGERAFVSTFRDIDPLFALDFSDPADPQSRGYITMPGYNSYMQAIDQHHILTVGRNTPVGGSGPTQVSLFDVRDLSQPRLVDQYTFERFSTSEAEADHHAFGWFAEHQVLALPSARVYWERVDADGDGYRESRSPVREDELFVFEIDATGSGRFDGGIEPLGAIGHDSLVRRSAFIDDVLYSVANDSIEAVSIADPTVKLAEIRLDVGRPAAAGGPEIVRPLFTAFDTSTHRLNGAYEANGAHAEAGPELSPAGFGERADRDAFIFTAVSWGDHVDALTATFAHHVLCGNLFFSDVAGIPRVSAFSQAETYAGGSDVRGSRYDAAPYRHKWEADAETFTTRERESLSSDLFDRALEAYDFDAVEATPGNQDATKDFTGAVDLLMVQWDWPAELPGESSTQD